MPPGSVPVIVIVSVSNYNLQNRQASVATRLTPVPQDVKRSSRSIPAAEYSSFYETYVRVSKCLRELELLLLKSDYHGSLDKAKEAIGIMWPAEQ